MKEQYTPSPEEIKKAESLMNNNQKLNSEIREKWIALKKIEGLEGTLQDWMDGEDGELSFERVVQHMANNKEVRGAVLKYLSIASDFERADNIKNDLAWALVDEFEMRYETLEKRFITEK